MKNNVTDDMLNIVIEVLNIASENPNGDSGNSRFLTGIEAFNMALEEGKDFSFAVKVAVIAASRKDGKTETPELVEAAMAKFDELYQAEENEPSEEMDDTETTDENPGTMRKSAKILLWVIGIVVLFAVGIAIGNHMIAKDEQKSTVAPITTTHNEIFKQETDLNGKSRVDTKFADAFSAAQNEITSGGAAKIALADVILERAGHNAKALAIYANAIGGPDVWADPNKNTDSLVENGYLSEKGEKLYYQLEGILKQKNMSLTIGEASSNGYNSGISDGNFVVAENSGVSGDRTAVIIEDESTGNSTTIMKRCGNIVYPSQPDYIPPGPTDETPPDWIGDGTPNLEPKDPDDDVLANDDVADWKKNSNGEEMTVDSHESKDNGATVDNGLQKHPAADARDAEEAAQDVADELEEAHDTAVDAAVVVDTNNHKDEVTTQEAAKIDPNW